jgi:hypothetical protein
MGVPDVYPFIITRRYDKKMKFIHRLLLTKRIKEERIQQSRSSQEMRATNSTISKQYQF